MRFCHVAIEVSLSLCPSDDLRILDSFGNICPKILWSLIDRNRGLKWLKTDRGNNWSSTSIYNNVNPVFVGYVIT